MMPSFRSAGELEELLRQIVAGVPAQTTSGGHRGQTAMVRNFRPWLWWCVLGGVLAVLAVAALRSAGLRPPDVAVPDELAGVWKTTAPRYAGRAFEIGKQVLVFQTGPRQYTVHTIARVIRHAGADSTSYALEYWNAGKRTIISLTYARTPDGLIRFVHQPDIEWRKTDP